MKNKIVDLKISIHIKFMTSSSKKHFGNNFRNDNGIEGTYEMSGVFFPWIIS